MNDHDEPADPHAATTRILRLLWDSPDRPPSKRGPKPKLELDQIVRTAIDIADTDGLAGISMQRVADQLDVAVGSLYTYVPGKPALLAAMLDTAVGWSTLPHELPGDWRQQFEAWAREDWEDYRQHPWIIELATTAPIVPGPNMMNWMESALQVLAPTTLSAADKMAVVNAVDVYVRGTAREAHAAARQPAPGTKEARDEFVGSRPLFERFPNIANVMAVDPTLFTTVNSEFGLQRLLDGIELFIASQAK
ncbi:TetR/AcrR family transcriptional regulator [Stackebrandtia nassauensis]|uniref:Transcriptional regulator, TetR family n=1 Tax=Stackebrandtia nassauensis (strain DSM 44728 / CIP 108903 / NRRL B-16338 / NBRC 102104 / LLR-40K-21) TaxID=446470 RepID=D3PVB1_STANL|nr:TetR/AcrR family transcriptional regulator C-terminal domain-containing protein [Stackebrandtia nassauensis]ADD41164.1 transcriptional regulator, TetR family [Stackebrandtia nassauensis DSM 44728]